MELLNFGVAVQDLSRLDCLALCPETYKRINIKNCLRAWSPLDRIHVRVFKVCFLECDFDAHWRELSGHHFGPPRPSYPASGREEYDKIEERCHQAWRLMLEEARGAKHRRARATENLIKPKGFMGKGNMLEIASNPQETKIKSKRQ